MAESALGQPRRFANFQEGSAQAPTATVSAGVRYFGRGPISEEEDRPRCGGSRFMARLARCHLRPGCSGRRRTASAHHEIANRRYSGPSLASRPGSCRWSWRG